MSQDLGDGKIAANFDHVLILEDIFHGRITRLFVFLFFCFFTRLSELMASPFFGIRHQKEHPSKIVDLQYFCLITLLTTRSQLR